jgi:acyl-CoA thioester hydrolase
MPGRVFTTEKTIEKHQTDFLGHLNNAACLQLLEIARWEAVSSNGYDAAVIKETKQGPLVVEITIQFKKEVKLGQTVTIRSFCESYQGKVFTVIQEILDAEGSVSVSARVLMGLFDMVTRKLAPPNERWLHAIGYDQPDSSPH